MPLDASLAELLTLFPFTRAIRGRLGDVVFKTYGRKIIVTRVPSFAGYVPTAAQRTRRDRMRLATCYAQRVYADPAAKAFYTSAAKKLGRQPFRLAVSDFLREHARVQIVAALWARADAKRAGPIRTQPPRTLHQRPRRGFPRSPGCHPAASRRQRRLPPTRSLFPVCSVPLSFGWRSVS